MPKQPPIRISGRDKELNRKLNKAVNEKKKRLKEDYGIMVDIQTRGISTFSTRKEYNQYKKELNRLMSNQFEQQKKPIKDIKREISRINRIRKKEYEKIKNVEGDAGKTLERMGEYGDRRLHRFRPLPAFKLSDYKTIDDMKQYLKDLKEDFKGNFIKNEDILYKENYMKALKKIFGDNPTFESDYLRLKKHLDNMSIENYMSFYYTKNFTKLRFIYDDLQAKAILDTLIDEWNTPTMEEMEAQEETKK